MPRKSKRPLHVFYSYSHKDARYRSKLADHLSLLKRDGLVSEWFDGKIVAGEELDATIDENLAKSEVVLLMISSSFLSSDYCWGVEMQRALKRHAIGAARVIPIIVRPVEDGWKTTVFGTLKVLPKDGKPVTSWPNQDSAWTDVTNGIREAIMEILKRENPIAAGRKPKVRRRPAK